MFRSLRKNKQFTQIALVGFGVLLMVSFLIPEVIRNIGGDNFSRTIYTLGGRKISNGDSTAAIQRVGLLEKYANISLPAFNIDNRHEHFLLLSTEAHDAGFVGPDSAAENMFDQLAGRDLETYIGLVRRGQASPDAIDTQEKQRQFLASRRAYYASAAYVEQGRMVSGVTLARALAELQGIFRVRQAYTTAPRLSEPRLLSDALRLNRLATLNAVIVEIDPAKTESLPARDEAALVELFNRCKDIPVGGGDEGIGYKMPDRVRVQWFSIVRNTIMPYIPLDPIEVQKRLLTAPKKDNQTEAQRRGAVEIDLRKEILDRALREAAQVVKQEIVKEVARLPEDGAFRAVPPVWDRRPDMVKLAALAAAKINEIAGTSIASPAINGKADEWLTAEQLSKLYVIGPSFLKRGINRITFPELAFKVRELGKPDNSAPVQVSVPFADPLEDATGNLSFFSVSAVRAESAPESLDEVRAQVVKDCKALDAYKELLTNAPLWTLAMTDHGASEVTTAAAGKAYITKTVERIHVNAKTVQATDPRLNDPKFVEEVNRRADTLDPTVPFDANNADRRTFAFPIPKSKALAICQIVYFDPLTTEIFRATAERQFDNLAAQTLAPDDSKPPPNPFTREAVAARLKAEGLSLKDEDEQPTPQAPAPKAPPAPKAAAPAPAPAKK